MRGIENPRGDLDADVVSDQQVHPGGRALLGRRQHGGQHRRRDVHALIAVACGLQRVVVIVGVHGNAVHQRRKARREHGAGANRTAAAAARFTHVIQDDARWRGDGSGPRNAESVEDRFFAKLDNFARDVLMPGAADKPRDVFRQRGRRGFGNTRRFVVHGRRLRSVCVWTAST